MMGSVAVICFATYLGSRRVSYLVGRPTLLFVPFAVFLFRHVLRRRKRPLAGSVNRAPVTARRVASIG